ncbi:GRB10-interacting GYF protein 2 isoform X2 [Hyalella azteca]|uniref:GRB10-interacting GYF protein 2 isoform X2 n=1 Tax=Hyalella azteca TaxID=294128 RepID=A0A8B7NQU7_HYAAZ|nr:GRB10-interacting GYF protein 2 isoform X2 [Hyalella azteca]
MSDTELKFGPEWMRQLSYGGQAGGSALLCHQQVPANKKRMWQRNINSDSALRFMANGNTGRGGGVSGGGGGGGGGLVAPGSVLGGATSLGAGGPGGRGRGGSMDRGRGRARGGPTQHYMRGLSYEEDGESGRGTGLRELAPPGMAMRRGGGFERSSSLSGGVGLSGGGGDGRAGLGAWGVTPNITGDQPSSQISGSGYHSSQNIDHSSRGSLQGEDRGGASSPRKEQSRASTENWRNRDLSSGSGDVTGLQEQWRSSSSLSSSALGPRPQSDKWGSSRLGNSNGWRPRDGGEETSGFGGGYAYGASRGRGQQRTRPAWDNRRNWGEEDRLPEWATDIGHEAPRGGSFDASGAFQTPSWSSADDDHGASNGFSGSAYSSTNHYSVGGTTYSSAGGSYSSSSNSFIATAGGLRARHKSGSMGPGDLLASDLVSSDGHSSGSKDPSRSNRDKDASSIVNGFHRTIASRTTSDGENLHSNDPQKRLSEALEVHGESRQGRPLMNGYADDSRSDSRSSHEDSSSPLSSEKSSQAHLEGTNPAPVMMELPGTRKSASEDKLAGAHRRETSEEVNPNLQLRPPVNHLEHSKSEPAVSSGLYTSESSGVGGQLPSAQRNLVGHIIQPSLSSSKEEKLREPELDHMALNADDLVAKLVDEEPKVCDPLSANAQRRLNPSPPAGFLPLADNTSADAPQWYYTDPQQEVQGPFSAMTMASWYESGYFGDDLLLRRDCDDKFAKLGDLKMVFGRVPFASGRQVPPLKMSKLRESPQIPQDAEKEVLQKQAAEKEAYEQAYNVYNVQMQIFNQQFSNRRAQLINTLSAMEGWDLLTNEDQKNLFMKHWMNLIPLSEPVAPALPSFLLNPSSSSAATLSLLNLPQHLHRQLSQTSLSAVAAAPSLQQQQVTNNNVAQALQLNASMPASIIAASTAANVGNIVQQLQHMPQHSTHSAASTSESSHSPHFQPLPVTLPEPQHSGLSRDPIRELVNQMSSVGLSQKSASPLNTPLTMPDLSASMEPLAALTPQPNPLQQLLLKLQSDVSSSSSSALPALPSLPQQIITPSSLSSGLQLPSTSSALSSQLPVAPAPAEENRATAAAAAVAAAATTTTLLTASHQPQEDVLQTFMQQLTKMHQKEQTQAATPEVSEPGIIEVDKKRPQAKKQEEKRKDMRSKKEEETAANKKQEERNKQLEEQKKKELEEEQKKKANEAKRKEEEKKKKLKQEEAIRKQEEKRRIDEENKKKAEEKKREQQLRKQQQQQEEMRRVALEEERKRMHMIEQEEIAKQQEAARLQQQQQQQQAAWGNAAASATPTANGGQKAPSLVHIQKAQQEKEKLERDRLLKEEEAARKQEMLREAAEKKKSSSMMLKWANKQDGGSGSSVKSLLQIQAEEEKEMKKRQTREQVESKGNAHNNPSANSAGSRSWGASNQPLSWASRASNNALPPTLPNGNISGKNWNESNSGGSAWNNTTASAGVGFWDTVNSEKPGAKTAASVAATRVPAKPGASKSPLAQPPVANKQNKTTVKQNLNNKQITTSSTNLASKVASKKKNKDEDAVKKIFSEGVGGPDDDLADWCFAILAKLKVTSGIDVPTFITFLRDVESPYEVHDYIRSYLGDNADVREFARAYLERRSAVLNATRLKNMAHDNILGPAPAINPASDSFQETKNRKQKGKKKIQKVDSGLLGFTVGGKSGDGITQ